MLIDARINDKFKSGVLTLIHLILLPGEFGCFPHVIAMMGVVVVVVGEVILADRAESTSGRHGGGLLEKTTVIDNATL